MNLSYLKTVVTPNELRRIQRIVWHYGGSWENKIKASDVVYITYGGNISWETTELQYDKKYELVKATEILENFETEALFDYPLYRLHKSGTFIVMFTSMHCGEILHVEDECMSSYSVGYKSDKFVCHEELDWSSINYDEIQKLIKKKEQMNQKEQIDDNYIQDEAKIEQGTIVIARRKSINKVLEDYIWQGAYFGYCNGKHLVDATDTSVQLADEVQMVPMLTKKEAKQKVSELFANPKSVTPAKIRNIIDQIKD